MEKQNFTKLENETLEAMARTGFTSREFRVLCAILRLTNGFHLKENRVGIKYLCQLTGINRHHVWETLKSLSDKQIISRNGKGVIAWHGPALWAMNAPPANDNVTPEVTSTPTQNVPDLGTSSDIKCSRLGNKNVPTLGTSDVPDLGTLMFPGGAPPKENLIKKTTTRGLKPPLKAVAEKVEKIKPFQKEAGAFLDMVTSEERIKFPNRGKLMALVRGTLVATEATAEDLKQWYDWIKKNDNYWGAREPPVIIGKIPEKFPTWFRDKKEGKLSEHGRPRGQDFESKLKSWQRLVKPREVYGDISAGQREPT